MKHASYLRVKRELRKLGSGGKPINSGCGICNHVDMTCNVMITSVPNYYETIAKWRHFSGDHVYPVKGGQGAYHATSDKWAGVQGELRRELARYLARHLRNS